MPKRALINHRPWLLGSLAAAVAFYLLQDSAIGGVWLILIKGSAVAMLAAYALRRGPGQDAKIIALALGLGAIGDAAIEISFQAGGAAFFLAHVVAMSLYLKYPRHHSTLSQKMCAVSLLLGTPVIAFIITGNWQVTLYALSLGAMAACAWMSCFPRYRVGRGAVLFVAADLLIFSREGGLDLAGLPDLAIWPLYYAGQFMIATGVVQTLRHELAEEDD